MEEQDFNIWDELNHPTFRLSFIQGVVASVIGILSGLLMGWLIWG